MTEMEKLVRLVEEVSGYVVPERDHERLYATVRARASAAGHRDMESYLRMLSMFRDGDEWRALLSLITINESYLFRAPQQFDSLVNVVVPSLVERRPERRLRLWSAGCAQGEEAATLAVVLAECEALMGWDWQILATDVDEQALAQARRGIYGDRAVSGVPEALLERHFEPRGLGHELKKNLRRRINYQHLNLVREPLDLADSSFDVVFLRNVLIYFRPESQRRVALAMARVMADDGYLFLGTSESLWQLCPELEPLDLGTSFCYRHRTPAPPEGREGQPAVRARPSPRPSVSTPRPRPRPPHATVPETSPERSPRTEDLPANLLTAQRQVVDALVSGGLETARALLDTLLPRYSDDGVLRGLEGLLYDLEGLPEQAVRSYRAALYLDQTLFQVRLLLARCLEKLGWHDRARAEYSRVGDLLVTRQYRLLPGSEELGLPSVAAAKERFKRGGG